MTYPRSEGGKVVYLSTLRTHYLLLSEHFAHHNRRDLSLEYSEAAAYLEETIDRVRTTHHTRRTS